MKILIVLTYYRPHISGLTIYAERLAKAFASRGHQVTVLTSQFDLNLPLEEIVEGVRIVRAPVWFRLSKGVVMPGFGRLASRLVKENDVIQLHLPQFDAAGVALRGRLAKKPTIITYHCDLQLPKGVFNRIANMIVDLMNTLAAWFTHRIVTYTQDYADHSRYTQRYRKKVQVTLPPVVLPEALIADQDAFDKENNPENRYPVIGMAARFATEKGIEVLLKSLPIILHKYPKAVVQFVGPYQNIVGEEKYFANHNSEIRKYQDSGNWIFLGSLSPEKMACFYPNLDVLILPSLNSTEAFGLVQIEAMMNGVPCVASNLPGVRQPVKMHKMGEIFEIGDHIDLAEKVIKTLERSRSSKAVKLDLSSYIPENVAIEYEKIIAEIQTALSDK